MTSSTRIQITWPFCTPAGVLRGMSTKQGPAAQIVGLTVAEVEAHLQEYEQEQIVYIAHPIQVSMSMVVWGQGAGVPLPYPRRVQVINPAHAVPTAAGGLQGQL